MFKPSFRIRRSSSARHQVLACLVVFALLLVTLPFDRFVSLPIYRTAHAAAFTPGNVVVYRVGSGTGTLLGTGNPVFLDEFTPAGALVQSIALPTTDSLPNQSLVANGTSTSEGLLTRSADGNYLVLTGYDATPPTASTISGTTSAAVNRVIGRVDAAGTINTTTALSDAFSGGNIRSATSTDGNTFWATGSNDGVRTTTLGSTTSTVVANNVSNLRHSNIFDNQLYISSGSGTTRIATVGTGTSTSTGQTITNIPGIPTTAGTSPYGFFFADLDAGVAGLDTLYVADDSAFALRKYSLVTGSWTLNGTVGVDTDDYRGLTATVSGTTVTLYATRKGSSDADGGGELVSLVDATGYNGAFSGTPTILITASVNTTFRGVALTPASVESAPSVSSTTPANGATDVALAADIAINFSEPVNVSGSSFTISCATSGAHTFALSGSSAAYTLNPDADFANSELCTVTVVANQVTDVDAADPPDNMAANYVFTFTTVSATPTLTINDVTQAETNGGTTTFNFTVSLSAPAGPGGVSFTVNTADGTTNPANAGTDYVAISGGSGSIAQGNSSTTVTVTVNGDTDTEPNETFFVNLTSITGATAGDAQGLGTITNDDVSIVPIHTLQGSGSASAFDGQTVTTTGIVTLLKTTTNNGGAANGFFIQTPDAGADADLNTSEGILVFTSSVPSVAIGDQVTVTGTVDEFFEMTEISPVTNVSVINSGNPLPAAVTLTSTILDPTAAPTQPQLEKYEGMRMTAPLLTTVAPNDNFFDVFAVITGVPRPVREPGIELSLPVPPDPTSGVPDCCIPRWDENPERISIDTNARAGAPLTAYTSNVVFSSVTGPLDYSFNEYRLIPEATISATANLSAVAVPVPTANEFTVAGYNIENFNNNATQRLKAALAIRDVLRLPHIIGVAEIFDLADLQALATEVNNISPGRSYVARLVEADGTSEDSDQDVGYLVDTSRVTINSVVQRNATETYIDPNTGQPALLNDRPPLVLNANVDPAGANLPVIVVVNHLRSFIDAELVAGDGPRVRAKRKMQAESLAALLQEFQTNNPTTSVISVGDYNAYQFSDGYTDPIATIKGNPTADDQIVVDLSPDVVNPNFINLVDELALEERYSFIFEGTPQALDHVLVNTIAHARKTRMTFARMNADFPDVPAATYASNAARAERNSDHDAAVAYFGFTVAAGGAMQFNASTYEVSENAVNAPITITRTGGSTGATSVLFSTSNGTAGSGDYTSVSQTVLFGDGEVSKTVNVPITNDSLHESNETVNLTLSTPAGTGQLGSPITAVLTILDDDPAGGIIRFTSSTYDTTESSGSSTITVERIGDLSLAATVNYATSDDSGASPVIPCATANGIASSRCDFTAALGTLRFAAGEGSKTFTVQISQDNFVEGLEGLGLTLSNPTGGAVLGTPSSAILRITDDATEPAANPIDDAGVFVRQHYHDFLNREPDAAGLAHWTNEITQCGSNAQCIEIKRINVSAAFFLSIEFQESGNFVRNFYVAALNRPDNLPRYLEFMRDTQEVQRGVIIGQPGALALLEANKQAFATDFVTRAEFVGLYPTTSTPSQYVDALYLHAGVTPSAAERQAAIDEFGGAATSANSSARARSLRRIIQNSAFVQREFPRAFVQMQYFGYLRRNPDDLPDGNLNGYNFWLNKLNQFNGNYIAAEMVKAFISSLEYRNRFGQ